MDKRLWQHSMGLRDILRESIRLFRNNWVLILLFVFCLNTPINLIQSLFPSTFLTAQFGKVAGSLIGLGIFLLQSLISLMVFIGVARITEQTNFGKTPSFSNRVQFGASRLNDVFWMSLLLALIALGLILLLIVPFLIWANYYSFFLTIVALRNIKGKTALNYSKNLVKGQWWRIFGIRFAFGVVVVPIFTLLSRLSYNTVFPGNFALFTIFNIVGAISTVISTVLFLNVELVKDFQQGQSTKLNRA
jgi:hypothetical protein